MVTGSIFEYINVIIDHCIVVGREEVDLDATCSNAFQPLHLAFTALCRIQPVLWLWGVRSYKRCAGIVPQVNFDSLLFGVCHHVVDVTSVGHLRPFPINETIGPSHLCSQVDVLLHQRIILGTMIICPIDPGTDTGLNPTCVGNLAWRSQIGDESRFDHIC